MSCAFHARQGLAIAAVRGDLLRHDFAHWDAGDPGISHLILDLAEAQSEIADALTDYVDSGESRDAIKVDGHTQ